MGKELLRLVTSIFLIFVIFGIFFPEHINSAGLITTDTITKTKSGTQIIFNGNLTFSATVSINGTDPASKLGFITQPNASSVAGTAFNVQPVVTVQDNNGNTVTSSNAPVTLAITPGTGTSGATLSGTTTISATNGVATFSGLSINKAGNGYTLRATSGNLTFATGSSFNITPGSAAKLSFTTQPSGTTVGTVLSNQPVVAVQDNNGNSATSSNASVTLAITPGTGTFGAVLSGTSASNAVSGVTSFSGLSINLAGSGYTLTATSSGLTSAISNQFTIQTAQVISAGGGGGGNYNQGTPVRLTGFQASSSLYEDSNGQVKGGSILITSAGDCVLSIPIGVKMLDKDDKTLTSLSASINTTLTAGPDKILMLTYDFGPYGATFSPSINLTLKFDPTSLSTDVKPENLKIALWDGSQWVIVNSQVDTTNNIISALISHFYSYAIVADKPITTPNVSLSPVPSPVQSTTPDLPAPSITSSSPPPTNIAPAPILTGTNAPFASPSPEFIPQTSPASLSPTPAASVLARINWPLNGLIFVGVAFLVCVTLLVVRRR